MSSNEVERKLLEAVEKKHPIRTKILIEELQQERHVTDAMLQEALWRLVDRGVLKVSHDLRIELVGALAGAAR